MAESMPPEEMNFGEIMEKIKVLREKRSWIIHGFEKLMGQIARELFVDGLNETFCGYLGELVVEKRGGVNDVINYYSLCLYYQGDHLLLTIQYENSHEAAGIIHFVYKTSYDGKKVYPWGFITVDEVIVVLDGLPRALRQIREKVEKRLNDYGELAAKLEKVLAKVGGARDE